MQSGSLVECIECEGNHHPASLIRANPLFEVFLNNKTSSSNVPLTWSYCLSMWPPQHDNGLLSHGYDTWHMYLILILVPHNFFILIL